MACFDVTHNYVSSCSDSGKFGRLSSGREICIYKYNGGSTTTAILLAVRVGRIL